MNIPLGGNDGDKPELIGKVDPDVEELQDPVATAKDFLTKHGMAKIVVVIDTHCIENGAFVYTGNSAATYEACTLNEVSIFTSFICTRSH